MPIIPKIMKKNSDTTITLKMLGSALYKAWMAIFSNLFLLIILKGLKTRISLKILII